ncbi:MAG TPA: alkaline phosphatase D family protein, partial [Planctomycetota bacterium]|nr:alkaline phosphatase D family protein [Planctomycetota bacterium]
GDAARRAGRLGAMGRSRSLRDGVVCSLLVFLPAQDAQHAARAARIVAGPMAAVAGTTSAAIWIQTDAPAQVSLRCWPAGRPDEPVSSAPVAAAGEHGCTAVVRLEGLDPGTGYEYRVQLDGADAEPPGPPGAALRFDTEPEPAAARDLALAFGSCAYLDDPGEDVGGGYEIFDSIAAVRPAAMLWLGDNVYYRNGEWEDAAAMRQRWAVSRILPELQGLLQRVEQVAVWDDHDYGPDNSDGSFPLRADSLRLFGEFFPDAATSAGPGLARRLRLGDVELFLLDDRSFRSPNDDPDGPAKVMFGPEQREWLVQGLKDSTATFKLVANGNQMLNPLLRFEALGRFPTEQRELLAALVRERIEGLLFLSGDRHASELLRRRPEDFGLPPAYEWYEFTSSPLTGGLPDLSAEADNPARVEGTWVMGRRSFGLLEFLGPAGDRRVVLSARADTATLPAPVPVTADSFRMGTPVPVMARRAASNGAAHSVSPATYARCPLGR